jgi:hypothetical protein
MTPSRRRGSGAAGPPVHETKETSPTGGFWQNPRPAPYPGGQLVRR